MGTIGRRERIRALVGVVLVAAMLVTGFGLVWWSGGTKTVVPHFMYFPVVAAALLGGWRAGALTGVAAGLLMGPLMPLNIDAEIAQPVIGWLVRMGFFVAIGVLVGEGRRRLLELAESRQRFVSAISHEVRTPLAAILGFAQLLSERAEDFDPDERREFAELIYREVANLSDIVDGYIIAARMDDSALIVDPKDTDLLDVVRSTVLRLPEPVRTTRVQVEGGSVMCWVDPMRAQQIVRTLLANALSYGGEVIRLNVYPDGPHAVLSVTSEVSGGFEELITQVLEPLNSGLEADTRPHPVGLGIAVASRLSELMGGELDYVVDRGAAIFRVRFPLRPKVNLRSTATFTSRSSRKR